LKKLIVAVENKSVAQELGIMPGDFLVTVNGKVIKDIFDYQIEIEDDFELLIERNGEQVLYEIELDDGEELGLCFETWLMDEQMACVNKCVFCFVNQMPNPRHFASSSSTTVGLATDKPMRETLYFKDDDPRLSFISGNYVTLTNVSDDELDRLISFRLSPLNISVHALNSDIRNKMMGNKKAGNIRQQLDKLYAAGIEMNFQVVLCKNLNDAVLDETIEGLSKYLPYGKSLSVVPAGLTRFREGLYRLEQFSKEEAAGIVEKIHVLQNKYKVAFGTRFVYAADELYMMSGFDLPEYDEYEEFPQLANGVGMMRLFADEFSKARKLYRADKFPCKATAATGELAAPVLAQLFEGLPVKVVAIKNNFFGESVTVSGLVTGGDLIEQLHGKNLGKCLFIPQNMLKADENVFLDGVTLKQVEDELGVPIRVVCKPTEFFEYE